MVERDAWPWWHRSSPLIGALGGAFTTAWVQVTGSLPCDTLLAGVVDASAPFAVHPAVGWAVYVGLGTLLGWVVRAFEGRFVYR
jgi:hypothetical protein